MQQYLIYELPTLVIVLLSTAKYKKRKQSFHAKAIIESKAHSLQKLYLLLLYMLSNIKLLGA